MDFEKWKWTLERKSEYIIENNIYHLAILNKTVLFRFYINLKIYVAAVKTNAIKIK